MRLVLLRHGESEWNKLNLFTGWTDVGLSDKGRAEAAEAGRLLREGGFDFDICHTSYLKRAIDTLNLALAGMDREWLPVVKSWRLNERHYGALQGLNKAETARQYGDDQVKLWRRSYNIAPPALKEDDDRNPRRQPAYRDAPQDQLPYTESLADAVRRVMPYYHDVVEKDMAAGRRVLMSSHGNTIRALVKHLDRLSDEEIIDVEIPTGIPLVYDLDDKLNAISKQYLGDNADLEKRLHKSAAITT